MLKDIRRYKPIHGLCAMPKMELINMTSRFHIQRIEKIVIAMLTMRNMIFGLS
jgi:hypothetical protein